MGLGEELIAVTVLQALDAVPNVPKGRTEAKEKLPVGPVDDAVVDATLPYLAAIVADMVRFQRLTGARRARCASFAHAMLIPQTRYGATGRANIKPSTTTSDRTIFIGPRGRILAAVPAQGKNLLLFRPRRKRAETQRRTSGEPPVAHDPIASQPAAQAEASPDARRSNLAWILTAGRSPGHRKGQRQIARRKTKIPCHTGSRTKSGIGRAWMFVGNTGWRQSKWSLDIRRLT